MENLTETPASKHNRGSTPEKERMDWRTPPDLHRLIENHYGVTTTLDAAASPENKLCPVFLMEADDTPNMSPAAIQARFLLSLAVRPQLVQPPAVWCNPPYFDLVAWMVAGIAHSQRFRVPWLFLVPSTRSEQSWWDFALAQPVQIGYITPRVRFLKPDGTQGPQPNHPSCVLAFGAPLAGQSIITTIHYQQEPAARAPRAPAQLEAAT